MDRTLFRQPMAFTFSTASPHQPDRGAVGGSLLCMADSVSSLYPRHSRRGRFCLRDVTTTLAHIPGIQFRRGWTLVWCSSFARPCVWPNLGESIERCFLWSWHGHADYFPRSVVDPKQETRARRRAKLNWYSSKSLEIPHSLV